MFIAHMPRFTPPKKPVRYPTKRQLEKEAKTRRRKPRSVAISRQSTLLREDSPDSSLGGTAPSPIEYLTTRLGEIFHGDTLELGV